MIPKKPNWKPEKNKPKPQKEITTRSLTELNFYEDQIQYMLKNKKGRRIYFNSYVAMLYGVNCAIIFNYIIYWVEKNVNENRHYHDGLYWTYYSANKMRMDYFPFLSVRAIQIATNKLSNEKIIIKGNFNKHKYDRTTWFSIDKERVELIFNLSPKQILTGQHSLVKIGVPILPI